MSIRITLFPEFSFCYVEVAGLLSLADLARGYAEAQAKPGWEAIRHSLNDLRGLHDMRIFPEGMEQFAKVLAQDVAKMAEPRDIAILCPPPRSIGMLSEYARLVQELSPGRCAIHQNFRRAMDWLGAPAACHDLRLPSGRRIEDRDPDWTT